jgi:hypothetical protein
VQRWYYKTVSAAEIRAIQVQENFGDFKIKPQILKKIKAPLHMKWLGTVSYIGLIQRPSAVPRARRKILRKMRLGARESVNKLSEAMHRDRDLHHRVRHGIQDASDR